PLTVQPGVKAAQRREQTGQAAPGEALAMQTGDQLAQLAAVEIGPMGEALLFAEGADLVEVALVAGEAVRGELALAAQVLQIAAQLVVQTHRRVPAPAQRTERSGGMKPGSTRPSTSAM